MKKIYIAPKATVVTMEADEVMFGTSATDVVGYGEYSKKKKRDWDFEDEEEEIQSIPHLIFTSKSLSGMDNQPLIVPCQGALTLQTKSSRSAWIGSLPVW